MIKNILITGSTDGIGKLAAAELAKQGHAIYIHGRNEAKVNTLVTSLKIEAKNENIKGFVADFSDLKAVSVLAEQLKKELPKIDVLINNAGVYKSPNSKTEIGLDIRFVVNYLAPYLLTEELLPILEKSESPRIINLSSAAQAPVSLKALKGLDELPDNASYAQSKLALTMWSFDFAQKHPNITTIAVNPGSLLNTNMVAEAFGEHWSPAEKGRNILVDLALSPKYASDSGKYFDNDKGEEMGYFAPAHVDSLDEEKIISLLKETKRIIEKR